MTGTTHRGPKRVTLFGAESTGKSTLAAQLGQHFNAVVVPEYGRTYTEQHGQNASTAEDMLNIARGHLELRRVAEREAGNLLIEDTDPVLTAIWSDILAGYRDPWFDRFDDYPDLYLFCDIDLPWVRDSVRYFGDPEARLRFHRACERELVARNVNFIRISGTAEQRLAQAIGAVEQVLR